MATRGRPPKQLFECVSCKEKVPKSRWREAGQRCAACWNALDDAQRHALRIEAGRRYGLMTPRTDEQKKIAPEDLALERKENSRLSLTVLAEQWREEERLNKAIQTSANNALGDSLPRFCKCCGPYGMAPKGEPDNRIEDENGNKWCPVCAYTILRSGKCSSHGTMVYPEIAAKYPPVPCSEIPLDLYPKTTPPPPWLAERQALAAQEKAAREEWARLHPRVEDDDGDGDGSRVPSDA